MKEDWQDQAACIGKDPRIFYPDYRQAKAICRECPVRTECLEFALKLRDQHGVWGGLNEIERTRLVAQRRRAGAGDKGRLARWVGVDERV